MDAPGTSQQPPERRVTVAEAARLLGVSPSTVRRMVAAGTLQAERVERPQGSALKIVVRPGDVPPRPAVAPMEGVVEGAPARPGASDGALLPQERAEALARYNRDLVGPLVEHVDRLTRRIEELAEENGRLKAQLEQATQEPTAEPEATSEPATRPWWAFWRV